MSSTGLREKNLRPPRTTDQAKEREGGNEETKLSDTNSHSSGLWETNELAFANTVDESAGHRESVEVDVLQQGASTPENWMNFMLGDDNETQPECLEDEGEVEHSPLPSIPGDESPDQQVPLSPPQMQYPPVGEQPVTAALPHESDSGSSQQVAPETDPIYLALVQETTALEQSLQDNITPGMSAEAKETTMFLQPRPPGFFCQTSVATTGNLKLKVASKTRGGEGSYKCQVCGEKKKDHICTSILRETGTQTVCQADIMTAKDNTLAVRENYCTFDEQRVSREDKTTSNDTNCAATQGLDPDSNDSKREANKRGADTKKGSRRKRQKNHHNRVVLDSEQKAEAMPWENEGEGIQPSNGTNAYASYSPSDAKHNEEARDSAVDFRRRLGLDSDEEIESVEV